MATKQATSGANKKNYIFALITVLSIFAMGQIAGSIDAAIELIGRNFNLDQSTTMFVSSIAALASVVFGLVVGVIAGKKVSFKAVAFFSGACVLIGGLVPFFVNNYIVLLVFRAIYGIGYGGMMSLENTFANLTLPKAKISFALGLGMFVGYGANCVLQLVGGFLAELGWNYVFLNNILLLIPFVLLLICCPNIPGHKEVKAEGKAAKKERASYPPVIFVMCALMGLVGLLISPLLIGCSFLSNNIVPNNTTVAGIVAVCFSLGCMVGGLVYSAFSKKLGRYCFTCFLLVAAIGALGSALATNIVLLCVMIFLGGMGFAATQSGAMMVTGASVSKSSVAMASSLIMACFNIGMFLCSPFQSLIGSITGDQLYVPLYIGAAVFVVGAVFFAIYNPFTAAKAEQPQQESALNPLRAIMKHDVYTIQEDATLLDALQLITDKKISGVPVLDASGRPVGFVSDGDILRYLSNTEPLFVDAYTFAAQDSTTQEFGEKLQELVQLKVSDVIQNKLISVDVNDDLGDVCRVLNEHHLKKVPVMENGRMIGIINASNITKYALNLYIQQLK